MNNKRVLIIRSNPVDPDPRVEKEADCLIQAGYSVDIFCWDRSTNHKITRTLKPLNSGYCVIYRIGIAASFGAGFKKNIIPLVRFQRAILRFIKMHYTEYSFIHVCDFDTAFGGYIGTRGKHIKFIYDIFDYYADAFAVPSYLKKIVIRLDTHIINNADAVIICSEQRRNQLRNAKPNHIQVIHNSPVKTNVIPKQEDGDIRHSLNIAYIGILNDGRLIQELLGIVSTHPEYELMIAGFGKLEGLIEDYAKKNKNIHYFGKVEYSRTLEIESQSDVMIAAYDPAIKNHRFAAPNKFYEALMLGKPLIMCKGTGFADIVEENGFGVCIDYSQESLMHGLETIRNNYSTFKVMSSKEKQMYDDTYSWEIMSDRLKSLYGSLSGS